MTAQRFLKAILVALMLMLAVPAGAQTTVSNNDIQRLQDEIYEATRDVSRLRSTDGTTAVRLQDDLDQLRDEVTYLKVKLRKEGSVNRTEYADLRDRIQTLRSQARGESTSSTRQSGTNQGSIRHRRARHADGDERSPQRRQRDSGRDRG